MPPKRKPSAPTNRVYKSSMPLQQSRLPLARKMVRYGKSAAKKVSRQETLTQMPGILTWPAKDEDDLEIFEDSNERNRVLGDASDSEIPIDDEANTASREKPQKLKRSRRKIAIEDPDDEVYGESVKSKKRRRRTAGDEPTRIVEDEDQRTITQCWDVPSSSPGARERRRNAIPAIHRSSRRRSAPAASAAIAAPQTPHRIPAREIPSSESPATPPFRLSPSKGSILKERSINVPIPFNAPNKVMPSPSKPPRLRVEDTFASEDVSQPTRVPTTPLKRSSPAKNVRWASPEMQEGLKVLPLVLPIQGTQGTQGTQPVVPKKSMSLIDEILDSDAESDGDYQDEAEIVASEEDLRPETCYGIIGIETQKLLENQIRTSSPCIEETQALDDLPDHSTDVDGHIVKSQRLGEGASEKTTDEKTMYIESQRLETQHVRSMAPRTTASDAFVSIQPHNVTKIVARTKNHDFRRQKIPDTVNRIWIYETAPTQTMRYMAVISGSKKPGEIVNEDGEGNAEFNAKAPDCGEFAYEILSLYELADPQSWVDIRRNEWLSTQPRRPTLVRPAVRDQLIANLKPLLFSRVPPELLVEDSTDTQEAEEQLLSTMRQYTQQVFEPPSSQPIEEVEHRGAEELQTVKEYGIGCQEIGYDTGEAGLDNGAEYLEVDDEERSLLDPEGLEYSDEDEELPHSRPPKSSRYSAIPSHISLADNEPPERYEVGPSQHIPHPSTQRTMAPPPDHHTPSTSQHVAGLSQAETVDLSQLTQYQTPRHIHSRAEIIFESPTRPISIFSSTPITLPTPRASEHVGSDSLVPYSMSSSQLLTKSQMLPASLLDCVLGPPLVIRDSDDEEDGVSDDEEEELV